MNKELLINARRAGNTTRLVDAAIQELFTTGSVILIDHYKDGTIRTNSRLSSRLLTIVEDRLHLEHKAINVTSEKLTNDKGRIKYTYKRVNNGYFEIKIVSYE